jgi:hypothetical protein
MYDVNMCNKQYFLFFNFFLNCKIQLVKWWSINSYSHNTNKWKWQTQLGTRIVVYSLVDKDTINQMLIWNTSYDQKESQELKLTIWFLITKSHESTWFPRVQTACNILLESSWQGIQLWFKPHNNRRSTCEIMDLQNHKSPNCGNSRTKCHLDVAPMQRRREYYKGEGGDFLQI